MSQQLFIFGADADNYRDQYVVSLGNPIVRYQPWKFITEAELEAHLAERLTWHQRIPGYRILLSINYLSQLRGWQPIYNRRRSEWTWLEKEAQAAAEFYLNHKIATNEHKYNRYKEHPKEPGAAA